MTLIDPTTAQIWADALLRSSVQGGIVIVLAAIALRLVRVPPAVAVWVWRIILLKMLVGLFLPLTILTDSRSITLPGVIDSSRSAQANTAQWIAMTSLIGAAIVGVALLIDFSAVRRLRNRTRSCARPDIARLTTQVSAWLGLRRPPQVREGDDVERPMLVCGGSLRDAHPAILVPSTLLHDESATAIDGLLAHELAHLRRRDLLWGWLATAAGALFFFHPLVWLAQSWLRRAQDEACDALALRATQASPSEYARLLLRIAQGPRVRALPEPIAAGVVESFRGLRARLLRLAAPSAPVRLVPLALVAVLCLAAAPTWHVTQRKQPIDLNNFLVVQTPDERPMRVPVIIGDGITARVVQFGTGETAEAEKPEAQP